jgi:predicted AlkP superfamily pyrophosphatase or phosphodiesterase
MRLPARFLVEASLAAAAMFAAAPAVADKAGPAPSKPPTLVVAISVDQFSADLFAQYRRYFTGGLAKLQEGAVFPSGFQSHAATETCPGHSTLMTGDRPARTGIIANNWFDPSSKRSDKRVYCAEDESNPASTSRDPVVSAAHLLVPTLGDRLKAANPASRNVAVSGKDRAVMMMGGHNIDAAYWWKGGGFVTLAGRQIAPAAEAENRVAGALIGKGARAFTPPRWCAARDRAISAGRLTVGQGQFALEPGKADSFRVSPRMDSATVDLAIQLADAMRLGKGTAPDILSVSLSATDYVGHAYGTEGLEMCIQLAELDRSIGRLLAHLDASGVDYVAVLSADHGGFDMPERLKQQALPKAVRVDPALLPGALARMVSQRTGIVAGSGPLFYGDGAGGDIYLNAGLSPADKTRVMGELMNILKAHPQVEAVFTADELAQAPLPSGSPDEWTIRDRARASFYPGRSGDVLVLLKRGVVPIPDPAAGYVATHGSVWNYDRRVPILFWRKGYGGMEQPAPVETVDIAPTLAAVLGLTVPQGAFDGRCLDIDGGPGDTCGARP